MIRTMLLITLALLVAAATAAGIGFTGHLDGLASDLKDRRDDLAPDTDSKDARKAVKCLDKGLRILGKPSTSADYAKEVKAAGKIAGILEKKLAGETALIASLDEVIAAYRSDIEAAREALADFIDSPSLLPKELSKLEKSLAKADRLLDLANLAATRAKELKKLSAAAKLLRDYIEEDSGNGGEPLTGETATWVISQASLAEDGNLGTLLATYGENLGDFDLDAILAETLASGDTVLLIQLWGISDWDTDPEVMSGLMNGFDTDGIPGNNFSGSEEFDASDFAGEDGHPTFRVETAFTGGGRFSLSYSGDELMIGDFLLPEGTPISVTGTATTSAVTGKISFSIPTSVLLDFVKAQGVVIDPLVEFGIKLLYSTLSGALDFESVRAGIAD